MELREKQITALKSKAKIETDREIYSIIIDEKEITINRDWSIQRENKPMKENIIKAIEEYCTKENIHWEYNTIYSAWAD